MHKSHHIIVSVLVGTLLLWASAAAAAYEPPIGIPAPPFGIDDVAPPAPAQWPAAEAANYYYIDNTHPSATDSGNSYGYPNKPRVTIPEITYAPGAYVELHGGPYTAGGQLIFTHNGSPTDIMWFRGSSSATKPLIRAETIPKGSYIIMENLLYDSSELDIGIRSHSGSHADHIVVRHCEFAGPGVAAGAGSVIGVSGTVGNRFHDIVIWNNVIHGFGDDGGPTENDYHGVKPGGYVDRVWILDNTIYDLGGDSVQVGSATIPAEEYPQFIYIGGNTFYGNFENDIDIKRAYDVIISQNDLGLSNNAQIVVHNGPARVWTIFNRFYDGVGDPAFITTGSTDTYLVGNVISNNHGDPSPDVGSGAIQNRGSSPITAVNNTIYDVDNAFYAQSGTNPIVSRNNLIVNVDPSLYHMFVESGASAALSDMAQTLFDQPVGGARIRWGTGAAQDVAAFQAAFPGECAGCLEADPLFVNAAAGNFALQNGSPAIDAGGVDVVYATFQAAYGLSIAKDITGAARPQGGGWDIGAYEYLAGGPPPDAQAPTVPDNLTATPTSTSEIDLEWDASTDNVGVTGYRIYRDGALIRAQAGTSYTDTGLDEGTTYSYRVAAYDAANNSSAQSPAEAATTDDAGGGGPTASSGGGCGLGLIRPDQGPPTPPAQAALTVAALFSPLLIRGSRRHSRRVIVTARPVGAAVVGMVFILSGPVLANAALLQVGPGKTYATPSQAAAVAQHGDTIEIDAGTYTNATAWTASNLTIRGVGGRAHVRNATVEGKGIWVIKGSNTTVENIEFSGASVPDENGAGIRQEGSGLTVRNCYFHDNENGILSGGSANGDILVEYSEFANNGFPDGQAHNMYIGPERSFTLRYSYSHHAKVGHEVKTRARANYILYNRLMNENTGTASYEIDVPNGGETYIIGNIIQQGPDTENSSMVAYAAEGGSNPVQQLYVINNTLVNDRPSGGVFIQVSGAPTVSKIQNNIFYGNGTVLSGTGTLTTNLTGQNPLLLDRTNFKYRLTASSPAINAGSAPGTSTGGYSLAPVSQYVHAAATETRPTTGALDIGAYEYVVNKNYVIDMPALTWVSVPGTPALGVAPSAAAYPNIQAVEGPSGVAAYSGGVLDTFRDRLMVWGGGHNSYFGNELYAFDINTMTWQLLTNPTANPTLNSCTNGDGTPGSRHTYNGLAYIAHADRVFALGGSQSGNGFANCGNTLGFNLTSNAWTNLNPSGTLPGASFENNAAYDPVTKRVWWGDDFIAGLGGLFSYDFDTNTWTRHNSNDSLTYRGSTIDTSRRLLVLVGQSEVATYDIGNANYTKQLWNTTGGDSITNGSSIGIDYDPVADRIAGMVRSSTVYVLNPTTRVWTAHNVPGAPNASTQGAYGRFRYVPSVNAFIMVAAMNQNVHFFKLTAGAGSGGGGTPPDGQAPTVPGNLAATPQSTSRIDLDWDASTDNVGVTGYRLYRDGVLIWTQAGTSYSDTGLNEGTTYGYRVAAYDAANNASAQSPEEAATTDSDGGSGSSASSGGGCGLGLIRPEQRPPTPPAQAILALAALLSPLLLRGLRRRAGPNTVRVLMSLPLAVVLLGTVSAEAANQHVRAGALGTADGSDWTNAYTALPSTLIRGDIYYIADGTYGSYTFDDAESSTTLITIKKATESDHGTATGWSSTYGDGQATFGRLAFTRDYYVFDGNQSNGYGFALQSGAGTDVLNLGNYGAGTSYNTVKSTSINCNGVGGQRAIYAADSDHLTFEHVEAWNCDNDLFGARNLSDIVIDHSYFHTRNNAGIGTHGDAIEITSSHDVTIRNTIFNWSGQILFFGGNTSGANGRFDIYGNVFDGGGNSGQGICRNSAGTGGPIHVYHNTFYGLDTENIESGMTYGGIANNVFIAGTDKTAGATSGRDYNYYTADYTDYAVDPHYQQGPGILSDPGNGGYSLSTGTSAGSDLSGFSPLSGSVLVDRDGNTRGADGTRDRGAYEYVSGGGPPPDGQAPTVPGNLSATPISTSEIDLDWDASTDNVGVTGYRIYRDGALIRTQAGTSYTDTGLAEGTTYSYRVAAYDAAGNSSAQSPAEAATTDDAGGGGPSTSNGGGCGPAGIIRSQGPPTSGGTALFLVTLFWPLVWRAARKNILHAAVPAKPVFMLGCAVAALFCVTLPTEAADRYVRQGAAGANNGTDWTNAYTTLPATLIRGDAYYIADGTYGNYSFNDPESGAMLITIKKATDADHGTNIGWNSAYGDGQAVFSPELVFTEGYYEIDGQVGGGPGVWGQGADDDGSSYGFRLRSTSNSGHKLIRINASVSHLAFRHVDLSYDANNSLPFPASGQTGTEDAIYSLNSVSNLTISHARFNRAGRTALLTRAVWSDITIEYTYFRDCTIGTSAGMHGEIWSANHTSPSTLTDVIFRYNYVSNFSSTGGLIMSGADGVDIYGNIFRRTVATGHANGAIANWSAEQLSTNVRVYNNTFVTADAAIGFGNTSGWTARNNLFYNNTRVSFGGATHDYNAYSGSDNEGEANGQTGIMAALFMDAPAGDYRLASATDAADAAIGNQYNTDPLGTIRGQDGLWDRGAYEYAGGPPGDGQAPSVPANVTATVMSTSEIDLDWDVSTDNVGVTGYRIYRDGALIRTQAGTSYTDTGLNEGTTYSYRVAAYDAANNSSAQSSVEAATTDDDGDTTVTIGAGCGTIWTGPPSAGGTAVFLLTFFWPLAWLAGRKLYGRCCSA